MNYTSAWSDDAPGGGKGWQIEREVHSWIGLVEDNIKGVNYEHRVADRKGVDCYVGCFLSINTRKVDELCKWAP
jgi:hypothetical protein